jgi:hypothetical protein
VYNTYLHVLPFSCQGAMGPICVDGAKGSPRLPFRGTQERAKNITGDRQPKTKLGRIKSRGRAGHSQIINTEGSGQWRRYTKFALEMNKVEKSEQHAKDS